MAGYSISRNLHSLETTLGMNLAAHQQAILAWASLDHSEFLKSKGIFLTRKYSPRNG